MSQKDATLQAYRRCYELRHFVNVSDCNCRENSILTSLGPVILQKACFAEHAGLLQRPLLFVHVVYLMMCPMKLLSSHADKHMLFHRILIPNISLVIVLHLYEILESYGFTHRINPVYSNSLFYWLNKLYYYSLGFGRRTAWENVFKTAHICHKYSHWRGNA